MNFFWRQPTYQSDLEHLFEQLSGNDPDLPAKKEAGLKRLWDQAPFDIDTYIRDRQSRLPQPANLYR
ncbi:DUF3460 family protein [Oxalobacter vibrioformis]|uniref:DUF3460 family protein n=1 Tax=Oxalobacter vibrioformis TaxID=933080 RepID=A0A9E9P3X6_9BURK|nr:DUF3460 family protein [Oxalobacter vibrioformis]WAW10710.1 DUF3460 family protein [Oxalobacter vibrioformis]